MSFLELPSRTSKPRTAGLTAVIDPGLPLDTYRDVITSHSELIDYVKLGWGTSVVSPTTAEKTTIARGRNIKPYLGGSLFELAYLQNRMQGFLKFVRHLDLETVEISNGIVSIGTEEKAELIDLLSQEFTVFSEVGYKDPARSKNLDPNDWTRQIKSDCEAGANRVVLEARQSGTSGICDREGRLRTELIDHIVASGVELDRLLFEAPTKGLQVYFIRQFGSDVNLGNIDPFDVVSVETLRLGLRGDTLLDFHQPGND